MANKNRLSFQRRLESSLFFKKINLSIPTRHPDCEGLRPSTPLLTAGKCHPSFLRNRGPQTLKEVGVIQESSLADVVILPSGRYLKSATSLNTCINAELQHLIEWRLQEI